MSNALFISPALLEFNTADRIRKAMNVMNVGVQELADHLQVTRGTVGNWINGRSMPRARDLDALAALLGVPIEWLLYGKFPAETVDGESESHLRDLNPRPALYKVANSIITLNHIPKNYSLICSKV